MTKQAVDPSTLKIGPPTASLPDRRGMVTGNGEPSALVREIIVAVMGLKDGEFLPIEAPNARTATILAQRQGSRLFKSYGIKAKVRGETAYFYKVQKEGASEVNHQDQRLPLPPLSA